LASKVALTVPIWIAIGSLTLAAAAPTTLAPKPIQSQTNPDHDPRIVANPDRSEHHQSPKPEHHQSREADLTRLRPIHFETILQTDWGHAPVGVTEINDPATWSALWQQNCGQNICLFNITSQTLIIPPTPQIDFTMYTVLVASPGTEGSPGYKFSINEVTEGADQIIVDATLTTPGFGCTYIAVLTFPEQIIIIPKTSVPPILNMDTVQAPACPI